MENINWYPGHMKKTRTLIRENLKMVDAVVEIRDARIPLSSRNPVISELTEDKPRIILLNKADLADENEGARWVDHLRAENAQALLMNSMQGQGTASLLAVMEQMKKRRQGNRADRPFRSMVVGIPNVGKSSFINRMTGRKSAKTGDRPGVTKGKQWLTMKNGMQLLDTPGILWPKFEDPRVGLHLAFCGAIKDEIMDVATLGLELIRSLSHNYPALLAARYKLETVGDDPLTCMEDIARKRGFIMRGGRIDYERCARTLLDEFRAAKIGRITLEHVEDEAEA